MNTGSLIQHMFTSQLADFVLPLPPLDEQVRITETLERQLSTLRVLEETVAASATRLSNLRRAVLTSAFSGKLVAQDPTDERASVLLERIHAERYGATKTKPARGSQKEPIHA